MTTVKFSGVTIDESSGTGFHLSRLVGYDDAAPSRYSAEVRPQAHGSFRPGMIWRDPRVVSVEGSWSGDSLEDAFQARRLLAGLQADGLESKFQVDDVLGSTFITAGLSSSPTMDDELFSPFFRFAFDVIAADPFKYGLAQTATTPLAGLGAGITFPIQFPITFGAPGSNGRVTTPNPGTVETVSMFSVSGGVMTGGFTLVQVGTGRRITVARDIPADATVLVNPRTGSVTIDGSPIPGYVTRSEWWSVPAGGTSEVQFLANGAVSGTPILTAMTSPAYL